MTSVEHICPEAADIRSAANRIRPYIHRTPLMTSGTINRLFDTEIFFKCENFQKVGAFKARGATNAVLSIDPSRICRGVATHSSGNHAQALAYAASLVKVQAYIVMPSNSSKVKVDAVKGYGGIIRFCEPTLDAREETLKEVMKETGAIEVHPYNDPGIIAGQATACLELIEDINDLDLIMTPVGGGGLLSGTALSAAYFSKGTKVVAAEPENADDAFQSFTRREFVPSDNPNTIADGLRTSLGSLTFPIILNHVDQIVTVSEDGIILAMRYLWERLKILIETSSAVPFAAILEKKIEIRKKKVGIIISGGNVDLSALPWGRNE